MDNLCYLVQSWIWHTLQKLVVDTQWLQVASKLRRETYLLLFLNSNIEFFIFLLFPNFHSHSLTFYRWYTFSYFNFFQIFRISHISKLFFPLSFYFFKFSLPNFFLIFYLLDLKFFENKYFSNFYFITYTMQSLI